MALWEKIKKNSLLVIVTSLIILFLLVYLADLIFITIYPGYAGVLFKRFFGAGTEGNFDSGTERFFNSGTVINKVYDEGLNIIAPWDKMYIYDVRIQEKKQYVSVLSQNGLTIEVVVSVRYHIERDKTPILHKRVGPEYERKIIIPSIISSVREVVGEYLPEEIYTTARHLIQDKLLIEVVEETGRIPIVYDDFIVENIMLPELINNAIELKLKQQQQYLEYEFRVKKAEREIERKEKEAIGISNFQKIVTESLSPDLLKWKGIMATLELAKSSNTKVIIVGGENGLPIIFNADSASSSPSSSDSLSLSGDKNVVSLDSKDKSMYDDDNNADQYVDDEKPMEINKGSLSTKQNIDVDKLKNNDMSKADNIQESIDAEKEKRGDSTNIAKIETIKVEKDKK
ncbi:MAG: prohibitin family protein [Desulfamplus sp.]|nr:prohibitin family protein [Desulfamplus sp.]